MLEDYKFYLASIAVCLAIYAYIPYLKGIFSGKTKPHLFTWIIWSLVTLIAVIIQFVEGAGWGVYPTLIAMLLCFWITILSFKYGSKDIKKIDYVFLTISLMAIPLWILTKNPTYSALLVTGIEIVAAIPTIRKSWNYPEQEVSLSYGLNTLRYILSIFAIASFSIATVAYPIGMVLMNLIIFLILIYRKNLSA